ncbi:MAG: hypothetical protein IKE43_10130 [Coriobacteriales bacterium]|nr:hypothetical protein [Coriobacteriales bacterium]
MFSFVLRILSLITGVAVGEMQQKGYLKMFLLSVLFTLLLLPPVLSLSFGAYAEKVPVTHEETLVYETYGPSLQEETYTRLNLARCGDIYFAETPAGTPTSQDLLAAKLNTYVCYAYEVCDDTQGNNVILYFTHKDYAMNNAQPERFLQNFDTLVCAYLRHASDPNDAAVDAVMGRVVQISEKDLDTQVIRYIKQGPDFHAKQIEGENAEQSWQDFAHGMTCVFVYYNDDAPQTQTVDDGTKTNVLWLNIIGSVVCLIAAILVMVYNVKTWNKLRKEAQEEAEKKRIAQADEDEDDF